MSTQKNTNRLTKHQGSNGKAPDPVSTAVAKKKVSDLSYLDMSRIREKTSRLYSSGISVDCMLDLMDLQQSLQDNIEKRHETVKKLMASYGIEKPETTRLPTGDVRVQWMYEKHKDKSDIDAKLTVISDVKYPVKPLNFMDPVSFVKFTSKDNSSNPLTLEEINYLKGFLMVKK